ncbi:MAG: hypothetical protein QOC72_3627 [Methylobacteriaceae bacterium]|nr:hypothetical protein [Methylobacteriaceae bacterium]
MTTTDAPARLRAPASPIAAALAPVPVAIAAALLLGLVLTWPRLVAVWQTGAFFDSDDAMRMVEVRDLMAGQGWFDLIAHGINPPHGLFLHWSRVVDVPLVALISVFRLFTNPDAAERLARIIFPLALQAGLYAGLAWCGGLLIGARGRVLTIALGFLSGAMFGQFQPGRVDHHAPQIVLLVFVVGTSLAALQESRARWAALAGVLTALSLAISIENLPFFVVLYAAIAIAFIVCGDALAAMLLWLAGGLAAGLIVFFVATISPSRYLLGGCDAFSAAHVVGGLTGAAALSVLALGHIFCRTLPARAIGVAAAGVITVAAVALTYPACFGDPLAQVDPFVKAVWLSQVREAMPLTRIVVTRPELLPVIVLPVVLGFFAALCAIRRTGEIARTRWIIVAALIGVGLVTAFWQIRVFSSAGPLAALPAAYAVLALADRFTRDARPIARACLTAGLCLPFSSIAYAIALPHDDAASAGTLACLAPKALAPLASLPPGLVLAPIDSGSHLLSDTMHSVIAAPYHRNSAGNRVALQAFLAAPDEAEKIVRNSDARYVMLCPDMHQVEALRERAPHGLAALLTEGRPPDWLQPVPLKDTPYRVFTLRAPSSAPHRE